VEKEYKEYEEFRSPRSSGVQEFRRSGVQEFRSSGVQEGGRVESPNLSNEINKSFKIDPSAVALSQVTFSNP
jgi:hypothetical protein